VVLTPLRDWRHRAHPIMEDRWGVVPHPLKRRPRAEAPAQTVVEGVEVRTEVSTRAVDRLADRAVEPFDVGHEPAVEVVWCRPVRPGGFPSATPAHWWRSSRS
jgi:hypothetical protein